MRFSRELFYAAPPEDVFAMLADPAYREAVGAAQGVVSLEVSSTPTGSGRTVVVDSVQRTAGLPAIATKVTGETSRAIVREEWTDPTSATVRVESPGKPARAAGTISLAADDAGSRYTVALDLEVKVPLLGTKLEKIMADTVSAGLDAEHAVGVAWLEGDR
ncbi:DUF2505 domain-containing protein [Nocardioides sp. zg-536]|uniref:DUF2505 domain-containing protein n=1 Tax=Nocardioides faecalis TaxID=2803858 RepID=A0A939BZN7_9ACTN|nr:DUF2505 domain-containing protein [Nocardioides faecalis]MBM9461503.1 DUF2505 domain-containing protein [Nocardioides faecalis]QVI57866.1 DUF2505 domain-containing protein [Nocardioides faecalis]